MNDHDFDKVASLGCYTVNAVLDELDIHPDSAEADAVRYVYNYLNPGLTPFL